MRTHFDAVIIGAGPAGAACAILLAGAGWSVGLVEKQRFPRRKVCGECIAASNLPLLAALGVGAQFDALAGPEIRRIALMHRTRTVIAAMPAAADAAFPWGRALGRETLDTLLRDRACDLGVTIFQPWCVVGIDGEAGNWSCHARAIETERRVLLRSPLLIDAHGSWETLRENATTPPRLHRADDLLAFKANFTGGTLADGLLPILAFAGGYGGMVRAGGGVTTLACCVRRDRLYALRRAAPGMAVGQAVERYLRRACRGVDDALSAALRTGAWIGSGPLRPGVRAGLDAVPFQVGNAAGEAHPIVGEGMSMALQAAFLLCTRLTGQCAPALQSAAGQRALAGHYGLAWRRQFGPRLRLAAAFAHLAMHDASGALMSRLTQLFPALLTQGAIQAGKVRRVSDTLRIADA